MSKQPSHRKPAASRLDDPKVVVADDESSALRRGGVRIVPEIEALAPALPAIAAASPRRTWPLSWSNVFWSAIGGLLVLGTGLGLANLVQDLFARSETLGYAGVVLSFTAALALIAIIFREAAGLWRLGAIERLHLRASAVLASDDRD